MLFSGVMGLGSWWLNGGGGYEKNEKQYLSFTYGIKHNKSTFIKYLEAQWLLNITDNVGHT